MQTNFFPIFSSCVFHELSSMLRKDFHEHHYFTPEILHQYWPSHISRQLSIPYHPLCRVETPLVQESDRFLALHRLAWNTASCTHPSSVCSLPQCSVYGEQEQYWHSLQGACMQLHCHLEDCCHTPVYPIDNKQHLEDKTSSPAFKQKKGKASC